MRGLTINQPVSEVRQMADANHKARRSPDLTGQRFGMRAVLGRAEGDGKPRWRAQCDCGNLFTCLTQDLTRSAAHNTGCRLCVHKGPRPHKRKRPYEAVYNNFIQRAKHPVSITYEQYAAIAAEKPDCHYCGAVIPWADHNANKRGLQGGSNLDRKDNSRGYEADNVVPCCRRCNYGKNNFFSYDEWVQIGALIRSWNPPPTLALLQTELENEAKP
jgi:hypothetical protein